MKSIRLQWVIDNAATGKLLRDYLREEKQISRKALADIKFNGGQITVNGKEENVRYTLRLGDVIEVIFPKEKVSRSIKPYKIKLHIIFEDEHVIIINKPPHLPTIPTRNEGEPSLAGAILAYYIENGIPSTFHAVSRLDRDTSGLVMVAKHRYMHDLCVKLQKSYEIKRSYVALVEGILSDDYNTIDLPISRKTTSIIEREVNEFGKSAITHYEVLKRYSGATLLQLTLETGRTHQIRVHMSAIGHPLLGDTLYGGDVRYIDRQALHSHQLSFFHPINKREYTFHCPIPDDIEDAMSKF
ncbi:RluA family pseudouridine synthase [Evansella cellulosilytica]|uniref:Pseudouridine synthase n=1 Tax=Evansella cellulosilytica (strain ATCC 21833 / DSM 2522 / FERM P-1141 / JCM 9156 / N-4) TaxID=649639 RepID=E6TX53_EVAC2|nr:RluA family pseudouridine synthase [Evansella cellulosilytica]ADU31142.1 pseudouridine synthase, RluA family [Evansella cellulosilytica DSM 2522]